MGVHVEIYSLWKEWYHRTKAQDRSAKVAEDFGDTSMPFDAWWLSHKHLFIQSGANKPPYVLSEKAGDRLLHRLQKALRVYDHNERYKRMRLVKYNFYDVGIDAEIDPEIVPLETDGSIMVEKKRKALTARVKKCIADADALLANAALGNFPCFELPAGYKPPEEPRRPRIHQLKRGL